MRINERMLLDGYAGWTKALDVISTVNGENVYWNYYVKSDNTVPAATCIRDEATEIRLSHSRCGVIEMSDENKKHKNLKKMDRALDKLAGVPL